MLPAVNLAAAFRQQPFTPGALFHCQKMGNGAPVRYFDYTCAPVIVVSLSDFAHATLIIYSCPVAWGVGERSAPSPATRQSSRCWARLHPCTHAMTRSPARCSSVSPPTCWTGAAPAWLTRCPRRCTRAVPRGAPVPSGEYAGSRTKRLISLGVAELRSHDRSLVLMEGRSGRSWP